MTARMGSLRVVHVSPAFFSDSSIIGGGERYATELARAMSRLTPTRLVSFSDRGFGTRGSGLGIREENEGGESPEPRIPSPDLRESLEIRLFKPRWYPRGQKTNPVCLSFLRALDEADVVHCHQFHILATTLAIFYSKLKGKKVFVTDLGGGGWDISYHVDLGRLVDGFLHLSEFSVRLGYEKYGQKNHVVYGGVDAEKFRPRVSEKRHSVLYVGRLLPHKGVNYLIEAMDRQTELRIIGRLWEPQLPAARGQKFLDLLKQLAEGKRISFFFDADDAQLVEEYSSALVTVLPSVYTDVFGEHRAAPELLGLALLESMACGTPVIATSVGALPEVVEDGVTGFIVPPNDSRSLAERIQWFREHPIEAQKMGERGRQRVLEKFTWEAVARRCINFYAI